MKNIFVITVTFTEPHSEVERYMEAHRNFLDDALKSGSLIMSGGQNPKVGGVIICKFWSRDEAQAFTHSDPLNVANVAKYEIVEFYLSRCATEIKDYICKD
jgi:uncharacterized protein YciI